MVATRSATSAGLDHFLQVLSTGAQRKAAFSQFKDDPEQYAVEVLKQTWWYKQQEVARAVARGSRVLVRAGQGVGKTHVAGGLVNWWFDTRDPSICLTSAPTSRQVVSLLWKEVRVQRAGRGGLPPKAPSLWDAADHYAAGYTAQDVNAFQGTHEEELFIVFDEALGVEEPFWEGAEAMLTSGEGNKFLAIYNPVDASGYAATAEYTWQDAELITISVLDHPNITAELNGLPPPYPKATKLSWVNDHVANPEWFTPISAEDGGVGDLEWPPASGTWYKPGAKAEARIMALWPSSPVNGVWSDVWFAIACRRHEGYLGYSQLPEDKDRPFEIGCDVARFGDDNTVMHVRRGASSYHHESHNGWDTARTTTRLKDLCGEYGVRCGVDPKRLLCKVDDGGVGGGVIDQRGGYRFVGLSASAVAADEEEYPNRRSELWFVTAQRAKEGRLDLSRLPQFAKDELRRQLLGVMWKMDSRSRRVVEKKEITKKRLGRSPDDADALNLAYASAPEPAAASSTTTSIMKAYGTPRDRLLRRSIR